MDIKIISACDNFMLFTVGYEGETTSRSCLGCKFHAF